MNITNAMQNLRTAVRRWLRRGRGAAYVRWGVAAALLAAPLAHAGWVNGGFEAGTSMPPSGWTHKTYTRPNVLPASPPVPNMTTGSTLSQLGLNGEATGNANNRSAVISAPAVRMPLSGTDLSSVTAPR